MIHRDDIPMDHMTEIEKAIRDQHPEFGDFKIQCVGDAPDGSLPPEVLSAMDAVQGAFDRSFMLGACIDCDARMPNYPTPDDIEKILEEDWKPAEGWGSFSKIGEEDGFAGWQCPKCGEGEGDDE